MQKQTKRYLHIKQKLSNLIKIETGTELPDMYIHFNILSWHHVREALKDLVSEGTVYEWNHHGKISYFKRIAPRQQ